MLKYSLICTDSKWFVILPKSLFIHNWFSDGTPDT